MKKVASPSWVEEYKVPVSIVGTLILLLVVEYVFHFPSSLFRPASNPLPEPVISVTHKLPGEDEKPLPSCSDQENLVCGKDGKTYKNPCFARVAKAEVHKLGACKGVPVSEVTPDTTERTQILEGNNTTNSTSVAIEHDPSMLTNTGKYRVYANEKIGYRFALPKYAFYQGFGAKDGAVHAVAVGLTASGVEVFDTADVRLWYYKKMPTNASGSLFSFSG